MMKDLINYIKDNFNKPNYEMINKDLIKEIVEIDKNESKGRFYLVEQFDNNDSFSK